MTFRMYRLEKIIECDEDRKEKAAAAVGNLILTLADGGLLCLVNGNVEQETLRIIGIALFGIRGIKHLVRTLANGYVAIKESYAVAKALKYENELDERRRAK
jgi:hypothetical protein